MENAQLSLGRGCFIVARVVRHARLIVALVRREMVAEVPDRVSERALLCKQQQKNAQELQDAALRHHRSGGGGGICCYWATASVRR